MRPYVEKHFSIITAWLKDLNISIGETPEAKMIYLLVAGSHRVVKTWQAYDINGFTFYIKAKDHRSQCQNSGVRVDAEDSTGQKCLLWVH
jgi:hypothetical protein